MTKKNEVWWKCKNIVQIQMLHLKQIHSNTISKATHTYLRKLTLTSSSLANFEAMFSPFLLFFYSQLSVRGGGETGSTLISCSAYKSAKTWVWDSKTCFRSCRRSNILFPMVADLFLGFLEVLSSPPSTELLVAKFWFLKATFFSRSVNFFQYVILM